jgi:hypothetical protein
MPGIHRKGSVQVNSGGLVAERNAYILRQIGIDLHSTEGKAS